MASLELFFILFGNLVRDDESLIWGLGCFVFFLIFTVDSCFFDKFKGWAEMVLVQAPFVSIEVVDKFGQLGIIQTIISEKLPDERPVFLFDMGVVVFLIGPRAGEFDFGLTFGEEA